MKLTVPAEYAGRPLSEFLADSGYDIPSPCGGRGTCGKCTVTLADGKSVKACQTVCLPGTEILTDGLRRAGYEHSDRFGYSENSKGISVNPSLPTRRGLALDIGTTTLAMAFVDLDTGKIYEKKSCLNPQGRFGADVLTRISVSDEHLEDMQRAVIDALKALAADSFPLEKITVAGNPTMLSIFCGVSPEPMGYAPFEPAFIEDLSLKGENLGLDAGEIHILPGASAYVGADVLAGVMYTGMTKNSGPSFLLDIGTNGEMAVYSPEENKLYVTSAAAGPAFEGANISCGVGGIDGAVSHVTLKDGTFYYETVGGKTPSGLCGSGLTDLAACLLDAGLLDETGALEDGEFSLQGIHEAEGKQVPDSSPVLTLTQKDIRELQLAKSAVRAGIDVLLKAAGIHEASLEKVYLAGGMGYYLKGDSAIRIGLLPESFLGKTEAIGNSALKGAVELMTEPGKIAGIPELCKTVDLNGSPDFFDKYIEYMTFPEK